MGKFFSTELNEIINYKGNEELFRALKLKLNEPFQFQIIRDNNNNLIYKGIINDGKYKGRGTLFENDIIYDGYFKEGKKEGFFIVKNKVTSKLIYKGFFKDNNYHRKGTLFDEEGNIKYEGHFKNGQYDGIGIQYRKNGKIIRKMIYERGTPLMECNEILYDENENEIYIEYIKKL